MFATRLRKVFDSKWERALAQMLLCQSGWQLEPGVNFQVSIGEKKIHTCDFVLQSLDGTAVFLEIHPSVIEWNVDKAVLKETKEGLKEVAPDERNYVLGVLRCLADFNYKNTRSILVNQSHPGCQLRVARTPQELYGILGDLNYLQEISLDEFMNQWNVLLDTAPGALTYWGSTPSR